MENFEGYLKRSRTEPNKVGFLIDMFKDIHTNAPKEDVERLSGRMAGIYKLSKGNVELILKVIWCSCTQKIKGSHLDYITKSIQSTLKRSPVKVRLSGHAGMETD